MLASLRHCAFDGDVEVALWLALPRIHRSQNEARKSALFQESMPYFSKAAWGGLYEVSSCLDAAVVAVYYFQEAKPKSSLQGHTRRQQQSQVRPQFSWHLDHCLFSGLSWLRPSPVHALWASKGRWQLHSVCWRQMDAYKAFTGLWK